MNSNSDYPNPSSKLPKPKNAEVVEGPLTSRDQLAVEVLAASLHAIEGILADTALTLGLHRRGFGVDEFQTGLALQTAAEEEFSAWRTAVAELVRAEQAFENEWVEAREAYLEFRCMARSNSHVVPATEFRVSGTVMPSFNGFVAQVRASYTAAQAPQFAALLSRNGFDEAKIAELLADVSRLVEKHDGLNTLRERVARQLDTRDMALAMFNLWVRELLQKSRLVAGVTLRPPAHFASRLYKVVEDQPFITSLPLRTRSPYDGFNGRGHQGGI